MTNRVLSASGVAGMGLAVLTASVGTSAANVALPDLAEAFGASLGQVRWVVVAYLIGMTGASVTVGALGDRLGHRPVLVSGLVLFSVTALIGALAPSLAVLIVARALQGVGAAVMTALPLAIARDTAGPDRVGRTMGLLGTTSAVGTAAGPALGGVLMITGASALGAVFTVAVGSADPAAASADLLASALRITFLIAALLGAGAALAVRFAGHAPARP